MQNLNTSKVIILILLFNFLSVNLKILCEEDIDLSPEVEIQSTDSEQNSEKTTQNYTTDSTESVETTTESLESTTETNDETTTPITCINTNVVYTSFGSVIGCEEPISTESLDLSQKNNKSHITIYSFKGIPYAKPPIGDLRFRETQPLTYSVPTIIYATKYGKSCIQPPLDTDLENFFDQSENCLFLNIWTKSLSNSSNLPVMAYIHGGAFLWGSSRDTDGTQLALRDIVYVNMNYRLGAFGFFCTNSSEAPGNQGLYDQTMALKWIKQNIRAFGGNPDNITLFGESAGSMSVSNLIISDFSKSLFNKAILQSGASMVNLFSRSSNYSNAQARRFASNSTLFLSASKPGSCDGKDWIDCLRKKSALDILAAQSLAFLWNPSAPWYSAYLLEFVPCYGDVFIPEPMNKSLRTGRFRSDLTVMIGHNEMEGALFTREFDFVRLLGGRYQPDLPLSELENCLDKPVIEVPLVTKALIEHDIKYEFFDNSTNGTNVAEKYTETFFDGIIPISFTESLANSNTERYRIRGAATHAFGDYTLTCPTILFGNYLVKSQYFTGKVYQYRLTYANKKSTCYGSCWCNVTHSDDVPLVFGFPFMDSGYSEIDKYFSTKIMNIWTNFAKNGEPGTVNGKYWPTYTEGSNGDTNLQYIELNPDPNRFGRLFTNGYDGIDEFKPSVIMNCKNYWDELLFEQI